MPSTVCIISQIVSFLDSVRDSAPVSWAQDDQAHLGLEIRLVETRENSESVEGLKLRVEVLLLVGAICEGMETDTVLTVWRQVAHLHCVPPLGKVRDLERDHLVLEGLRADGHLSIVDLKVSDGQSL